MTITPTRDGGGDLAVVTTNHATAFFKLSSAAFLGSTFEEKFNRRHQVQVDSVEATGVSIVTIADVVDILPPFTGTPVWAIRVHDVADLPNPVAYQDASPPNGGSRAHDFAIDWDFDVGLLRTSRSNVILAPLSAPPALPTVLPSGSDAYAYATYDSSTGRRVFSSDSVVIGSEQNGSLYGVTIGARLEPITNRFIGVADIIDLLLPSPTVNAVDILPDDTDEVIGCVPLDLAISFNQNSVIVRSTDTVDQTAPTGDGPDLVIIDLATGSIQRFGGSGTVHGTDSLAQPSLFGYIRVNRRIMSISEDPTPNLLDYTHFVR